MPLKALREELLNTHQTLGWMDLVISNIQDGVCVIDSDCNIVFTNDAFAELASDQRIYLLGRNFCDVLPLQQDEKFLKNRVEDNHCLFQDASVANGIYQLKSEKKTYHIKLSSNHIRALNQTVLLLQDVTGQEELNMMRHQFISLASHQLRTPLSVINVHAQMLNDEYEGELNKGQKELITNVLSGVQQMQQLVATLLNTGRIEEGKIDLKKKEINIEGLIKKIARDLQPQLHQKHIILEIIKPKVVPNIVSDVHHLREIISNLLVNAIQYSTEFSKITISVNIDRAQRQMVISILDRGIGIPEKNHAQIFSPFYRAENAISHFSNGTGLGLYTVKLLVNELDGDISFKSIENKGTTFYIKLPL